MLFEVSVIFAAANMIRGAEFLRGKLHPGKQGAWVFATGACAFFMRNKIFNIVYCQLRIPLKPDHGKLSEAYI